MQIAKNKNLAQILGSYGFFIVLAIVVVFFSVSTDHFLTVRNLANILHSSAPMMILAAGFAMIVMTGKLDISIGSTAYLATGIGSILMMRQDVPPVAAILIIAGIGVLCGAINGLVIVYFRVNPLIATMGTMFIYRGLGLLLTKSMSISIHNELRQLGNSRIGPLYSDFLLALAFLIVMQIVLRYTPYGRNLLAIGNDADVARRLGVNVTRVDFTAFVLSGLFASIGGILILFQLGAHNSYIGNGLEFTGMAVTILGGVSLFGGEGSLVPGFMIGVWALSIIESGLNHLGASPYAYPFVRGGIIFLAMYADSMKHKVSTVQKVIVKDLQGSSAT